MYFVYYATQVTMVSERDERKLLDDRMDNLLQNVSEYGLTSVVIPPNSFNNIKYNRKRNKMGSVG